MSKALDKLLRHGVIDRIKQDNSKVDAMMEGLDIIN